MIYTNGVEVFSGQFGKVKDVIKEWKLGLLPISDEIFCKNGCKES